jgi:hypothetical protein
MRNVIAAAGIGAALITTPVVAAETASADLGQNCKTEWNTMYNCPSASARPASTQTAARKSSARASATPTWGSYSRQQPTSLRTTTATPLSRQRRSY